MKTFIATCIYFAIIGMYAFGQWLYHKDDEIKRD